MPQIYREPEPSFNINDPEFQDPLPTKIRKAAEAVLTILPVLTLENISEYQEVLETLHFSSADWPYRYTTHWINQHYPALQLVTCSVSCPYGKILPKKVCKSYINLEGELFWVLGSIFETWKAENKIRWCSVGKIWAKPADFIKVHTTKNQSISMAQGSHFCKEHVSSCPICQNYWKKELMQIEPQTETHVCPDCISQLKEFKNPPHTLRSVFGPYHSHQSRSFHSSITSFQTSGESSNWTFIIQRTPHTFDKNTLPMGIELELECIETQPQLTAWYIYKAQQEINPNWHNFYTESDGSLSDQGLEIITNPMTLTYHQMYWPKMLPIIRKYCVGWDTEKTARGRSYGIHITTSRRYWSDLMLARLVKFLNEERNQLFLYILAQRTRIYQGKTLGTSSSKLVDLVGLSQGKISASKDRYTPLYIKPNHLIEFRLFQSTLNKTSFMKNLEFVHAFHHWAKTTALNYSAENFISWLKQTSLQSQWPHLIDYLSKPKFTCKGSDPIINPWMGMFLAKGQQPLFNFIPCTSEELNSMEDERHVFDNPD